MTTNFTKKVENLIQWHARHGFTLEEVKGKDVVAEGRRYFAVYGGDPIEVLVYDTVESLMECEVCEQDLDYDEIETALHEGAGYTQLNVGDDNGEIFYIAADDGKFYIIKVGNV